MPTWPSCMDVACPLHRHVPPGPLHPKCGCPSLLCSLATLHSPPACLLSLSPRSVQAPPPWPVVPAPWPPLFLHLHPPSAQIDRSTTSLTSHHNSRTPRLKPLIGDAPSPRRLGLHAPPRAEPRPPASARGPARAPPPLPPPPTSLLRPANGELLCSPSKIRVRDLVLKFD